MALDEALESGSLVTILKVEQQAKDEVSSQASRLNFGVPNSTGCLELGQSWTLGEYSDGCVKWQKFSREQTARTHLAASSFSGRTSKVVFRPDGVPAGFFSADGIGCSVILLAYENGGCTPDRGAVAEAVRVGDAPFVPPDRHPAQQWLMKRVMQAAFTRTTCSQLGTMPLRNKSLCYFDIASSPGVRGYVALTIDDVPCRFSPASSRVREVRELLAKYGARATFMVVGGWVNGHESGLVELLKDGHEFGNHCMLDRRYDHDSHDDFAHAVDECSAQIRRLQNAAGVSECVRWFRAPHGKFTERMHKVIGERNLVNVMCDTYASCPVVQDGEFIGRFLSSNVQHGGIMLIHMPELGLREWCFKGLQNLLEGLRARRLQPVTISELVAFSRSGLSTPEEIKAAAPFSEGGQLENLRSFQSFVNS